MDTERHWHREVMPESAERALGILVARRLGPFYLAGGTGLALHLGHRLSMDLDLFSSDPFDEEKLMIDLTGVERLSVISKGRQTLHVHIAGVKVSFLGYPYPVLFPVEPFMGMPVADPRDIACMKLSAIAGRGSRRDFVDVYVTAVRYGLAPLLELFRKKYAEVDFNFVHVLKSLTYFEDAGKEPMPKMLSQISWTEIVRYFEREAPRLLR